MFEYSLIWNSLVTELIDIPPIVEITSSIGRSEVGLNCNFLIKILSNNNKLSNMDLNLETETN